MQRTIDPGSIYPQPLRLWGPRFDMSSIQQVDRPMRIPGFAVKYVLQGTERYTVNGEPFPVHAGQYLLANRCSESHVVIDSDRPVEGFCIELTTALMDEVVHGWSWPESFATEKGECFFVGPEFLEGVHDSRKTWAGLGLKRMADRLSAADPNDRIVELEAYYTLAEQIVRDHLPLLPRLRSIKAVRSGTRKDIYRRIQRAKAFMDATYHKPSNVADLAREAAMSEYHFFRAFRAVEGTTPHQYVTALRLREAHSLLQQGHYTVQDVALRLGFADAPTFSKAFRKFHGHTPSVLLRGMRRI
jgi:AraC family transcriptional regulator